MKEETRQCLEEASRPRGQVACCCQIAACLYPSLLRMPFLVSCSRDPSHKVSVELWSHGRRLGDEFSYGRARERRVEWVYSGRGGEGLIYTEHLIRERGSQPSVTVRDIHCLEEPIESFLHNHRAASSLPCCLLANGCNLFKKKLDLSVCNCSLKHLHRKQTPWLIYYSSHTLTVLILPFKKWTLLI